MPTDWDRMAAGVIAGHIIECGAQCTGEFHRLAAGEELQEMGFPLIEASPMAALSSRSIPIPAASSACTPSASRSSTRWPARIPFAGCGRAV